MCYNLKNGTRRKSESFAKLNKIGVNNMAKMVEIKCGWEDCENTKMVRATDVKRGWGLYCSKSCAAKQRVKISKERKAEVDAENDTKLAS